MLDQKSNDDTGGTVIVKMKTREQAVLVLKTIYSYKQYNQTVRLH